VLLLASREQRIGLATCLERLAADRATGGLGLHLERAFTFSVSGDAWTIDSPDDAARAGAPAPTSAVPIDHGDGRGHDAPMRGDDEMAAHRLWIFRTEASEDSGSARAASGVALPTVEVPPPYFESQRLMRCACHALNNLLGRSAFTPPELDALAVQLGGTWLSLAHRWPLLGNYDVSVVLSALQACDPPLEAAWWDARKDDAALVDAARGVDVVGLLLNTRARPRLLGGLVPFGRHWSALRGPSAVTGGVSGWWDLDSNHAAPTRLADEAALLARLHVALREQDGHAFVVRRAGTPASAS